MRTNGFALFSGEDAAGRARRAAARVERRCREVLVGFDGQFALPGEVGRDGRKEVALAFSLERGTFPLVHGFVEGWEGRRDGRPRGEFSVLGKSTGGYFGERDALGTRGLWAVEEGPEAGTIASDYRLLEGGARLVRPGTIFDGGEQATRRVSRRRAAIGFDEAVRELASLLDKAVEKRVSGERRVAVSFSGGLDSSILALLASKHTEVVLCSAFAPGSRDETQTSRAAGALGLRLESALLDHEAVAGLSKEAVLPPGDSTAMDLALWCIYSTTGRLADREKAGTIILGQLADELFGGYAKYTLKAMGEGPRAAELMMREDVRGCAERGFLRDEAACSRWAEVRFPFADEGVASFGEGLPFDYKVRDGERKAVLRAAALELGLPEELVSAPKKAAQFSSGAAKLVERL